MFSKNTKPIWARKIHDLDGYGITLLKEHRSLIYTTTVNTNRFHTCFVCNWHLETMSTFRLGAKGWQLVLLSWDSAPLWLLFCAQKVAPATVFRPVQWKIGLSPHQILNERRALCCNVMFQLWLSFTLDHVRSKSISLIDIVSFWVTRSLLSNAWCLKFCLIQVIFFALFTIK